MKTNEEFIREVYAKHEMLKTKKQKLRHTIGIVATAGGFVLVLGVVLAQWKPSLPPVDVVITPTNANGSSATTTTTSILGADVCPFFSTTAPTRPWTIELNRGKTVAERYPGEMGIGGDSPYRNRYFEHKFEVDGRLAALTGEDVFDEWYGQFDQKDPSKRSMDERNLYTFVNELNVEREAFTAYVREHYKDPDDGDYYYLTDEDIRILYGDTQVEVYIHFSWEFVVKVRDWNGVRFYTPGWLAEHTAQEIAEAGITKDQIRTVLNNIGNLGALDPTEIEALWKIVGEFPSTTTTTRETHEQELSTRWTATVTSGAELPTGWTTTAPAQVPEGFTTFTTTR